MLRPLWRLRPREDDLLCPIPISMVLFYLEAKFYRSMLCFGEDWVTNRYSIELLIQFLFYSLLALRTWSHRWFLDREILLSSIIRGVATVLRRL